MKRRLFNAAALLLLALCVVAAGLWVWSYFGGALFSKADPGPVGIQCDSYQGIAFISWTTGEHAGWLFVHNYSVTCPDWPPAFVPMTYRTYGTFEFDQRVYSVSTLAMKFSFLVTGFVILPLVWTLMRLRQGRRKPLSCCLVCGYDLRGTASGGPCPECGAAQKATTP